MAFTERYVTVTGAGDHNGTAEAHAWSFAEMIAAAPAAETRVNIKAGSYSEGTTTLPANGTAIAPIVLRGYSTTIGDLDNQGRSDDGTLNTANMPDFTLTGLWTPSPNCILQNLDITGALSSYLIGSFTADLWGAQNCRVVNSQNNASAGAIQFDDTCFAVNCDFACTGASHGIVVDGDNYIAIDGCRFTGVLNTATWFNCQMGTVTACVFIGAGNTSIAISFTLASANVMQNVSRCSFYNFGTAIRTPNAAAVSVVIATNNHVTDCAKYLDNPYVATSQQPTIEAWNRTRDNTTPRTGILSAVLAGEVTTDAGDSTTDYIGATNLRLKSTAAGKGAGMMPYTDIGAHGCAAPTIPAEADVETGVEYGYADDLQTGTLVAGGGTGGYVPVSGGGIQGVFRR
jgi:hypothetical protein